MPQQTQPRTIRRNGTERTRTQLGWLDGRHTFSFGRAIDRNWMGFGPLRVINDDRVQPGQGFGMHPHDNMEIITYIVQGHLEHKDSGNHRSVIGRGGVQVMSAGTGVLHSEFNPSDTEPVRLLQIWIEPAERDVQPAYADRHAPESIERNTLRLLVSGDGRDGSLSIHQDALVLSALLDAGEAVTHPTGPGRRVWLQVVSGTVSALGETLTEGDGLGIEDADSIEITASENAELLVFDLP